MYDRVASLRRTQALLRQIIRTLVTHRSYSMTSRYAAVHGVSVHKGPGDARPTAQQIVDDNGLNGKLAGKVALVTGCSSGIGVETARALKSTGMTVYVTGRNPEKTRQALSDILEPGKLEIILCDNSSLASVDACAKEFLSKSSTLNILVLNAGIMGLPQRETTKDGFEAQFGVNHLAHFLLFQRLKSTLLASATPEFPSRVISVSSIGHRQSGINFSDINFEKPDAYNGWKAYGQSKTANIYMANEIERRYGSRHLHANSLHPGGIWTGLQKASGGADKMGRGRPEIEKHVKSVEQGAATTVVAALDKDLHGKGGYYLEDCAISGPAVKDPPFYLPGYAPWAFDEHAEGRLWTESCRMVAVEDDE